jgi:predicted DNA-binding protein YlxM (UPF0122 family)
MTKDLSVTEYCITYNIARNAVHRRIKKFEDKKEAVNNIVDVKRIGPKIIILTVDTRIEFKTKKGGNF